VGDDVSSGQYLREVTLVPEISYVNALAWIKLIYTGIFLLFIFVTIGVRVTI
jgi:hypothetical protein